ncbi:MAG: DUF5674 family protein [Minisyncoccales bacterium]
MEIKIVKDSINKKELIDITRGQFGNLVKAAVDIEQEIMAVGGEMHADEEVALMEQENSKREHTWCINLYPEKSGEELIEFDSINNIKPFYDNRSRDVENPKTKEEIKVIVNKLVVE